jgi:hypothetical protein
MRAHLGCFQWWWLLVRVIRKAWKRAAAFLYLGKGGQSGLEGGVMPRIGFGNRWRIGLKGVLSSPAASLAQLEVGTAMRRVGRVERERTDSNRERRNKGQQGEGMRG